MLKSTQCPGLVYGVRDIDPRSGIMLGLPFTCFVALGKSVPLSGSQFPRL